MSQRGSFTPMQSFGGQWVQSDRALRQPDQPSIYPFNPSAELSKIGAELHGPERTRTLPVVSDVECRPTTLGGTPFAP